MLKPKLCSTVLTWTWPTFCFPIANPGLMIIITHVISRFNPPCIQGDSMHDCASRAAMHCKTQMQDCAAFTVFNHLSWAHTPRVYFYTKESATTNPTISNNMWNYFWNPAAFVSTPAPSNTTNTTFMARTTVPGTLGSFCSLTTKAFD